MTYQLVCDNCDEPVPDGESWVQLCLVESGADAPLKEWRCMCLRCARLLVPEATEELEHQRPIKSGAWGMV